MRTLQVAVLFLATPLLAGCTAGDLGTTPCSATDLIRDGVAGLQTMADADGGFAARNGGEPDPRTTAWALLAAGLARRTGIEGLIDPEPHVTYLKGHADGMLQEGTTIDSAANNISLLRVALLSWGTPAGGVPVDDPQYPEARSLLDAWEARYDADDGTYGVRFNEHLFGAFAMWLGTSGDPRQYDMANATVSSWHKMTEVADDPVEHDAWYAGQVLMALGPAPEPHQETLRDHALAVLDRHQDGDGGVRGFVSASHSDASTTAAALLGWRFAGRDLDSEPVAHAVDHLCTLRAADGTIPFNVHQSILRTKTTAEVVVALSLLDTPIPWGPHGAGPAA